MVLARYSAVNKATGKSLEVRVAHQAQWRRGGTIYRSPRPLLH
ncbi:hypothetical protein ABH924_004440 [Arthrobacter sp. GAS37]